eukprot:TRINITY_DN379699_c0_g1_i1.p1 TRINITY_DN379699_c0_g1~~TRINITY_DN379699_c0_g1_i1.p1  ORF type:complete len:348 (-),score=48.14 TRINITY_DN379699_c0_g1_i1:141-1184(-)
MASLSTFKCLASSSMNKIALTSLKEKLEDLMRQNSIHEYNSITSQKPRLDHDVMVANGEVEAACKPENIKKNRNWNVFPLDNTRVRLLSKLESKKSPVTHDKSDFISANHIHFDFTDSRYIASQAPTHPDFFGEDTLDDFWRCQWEYRCPGVVMLVPGPKIGESGCAKYYPDMNEPKVQVEDFSVHLDCESDGNTDFVTRKLVIEKHNTGKLHEMFHFHYKGWPNFGVPEDPNSLLEFVSEVNDSLEKKEIHQSLSCSSNVSINGPLTVHCSGGVGRTGTFIGIHSLLDWFSTLKDVPKLHEVNVRHVVQHMRRSRHPWMVEGQEQYKLIYECLIEALKQDIHLLSN